VDHLVGASGKVIWPTRGRYACSVARGAKGPSQKDLSTPRTAGRAAASLAVVRGRRPPLRGLAASPSRRAASRSTRESTPSPRRSAAACSVSRCSVPASRASSPGRWRRSGASLAGSGWCAPRGRRSPIARFPASQTIASWANSKILRQLLAVSLRRYRCSRRLSTTPAKAHGAVNRSAVAQNTTNGAVRRGSYPRPPRVRRVGPRG
jgi:hypothetical protein